MRNGASFWLDRNGYMATWRWWCVTVWFELKCKKQAACRKLFNRSFIRVPPSGR
jgi:hypothetical protein